MLQMLVDQHVNSEPLVKMFRVTFFDRYSFECAAVLKHIMGLSQEIGGSELETSKVLGSSGLRYLKSDFNVSNPFRDTQHSSELMLNTVVVAILNLIQMTRSGVTFSSY